MEKESVIEGLGNRSRIYIPEQSEAFNDVDIFDKNIGLRVEFIDLEPKGENKFLVESKDEDHLDYLDGENNFNIEDPAVIYLPSKIHNRVASISDNSSKVKISVFFKDGDSKEPFPTISLNAKILGTFKKNLANVAEPASVDDSASNLALNGNQEKPLDTESTTQESKAEVDACDANTQEVKTEAEQSNTESKIEDPKKKSRLILIIAAAIAGFILLLLAIFALLYFTGALKSLFGGEKAPQAQEQTIEDPQSDLEESASDESLSDNTVEEDETTTQDDATNLQDNESVVANSSQGISSSAQGACSIASNSDDLILIKSCLATNPQANEIKALVEESFANNRCNVGKRLLSSYGRRDAKFAYMYGQYFDENSSLSTSCEVKDIDKAIYWYEKAVQLGDTTNAKAALDRLK